MESPIQHLVLWSFSNQSDLQLAMEFLNALPSTALRDGKPYLTSVQAGRTMPHAPVRDGGFNLASLVTFRNDEDRAFFVKEDPLHRQLVEMVTGKLTKEILVLDFAVGK